jgi:hypothetical protein
MLGVAWRYKAFAQLGMEYLRAPWEAVRFADREWWLTRRYDAE